MVDDFLLSLLFVGLDVQPHQTLTLIPHHPLSSLAIFPSASLVLVPSHLSRRLFVRPSDATRLQSEGSEAKESLLRESDKKDEEKEWIEGINISTCGDI